MQTNRTWVVVLEVTSDGNEEVDLATVEALVEAVRDCRPAALYAPDRYAFQLWIESEGPAEALLAVISRWRQAARSVGVPENELVRAEVLTPGEFAMDMEHADPTVDPPDWLAAEEAALRTTAQLVTVREPRDARALVRALVEELGGYVVPACEAGGEAVGGEFVFGTDLPMAAIAPDGDAGRVFREMVPPVLESAREAADRLRPAPRRLRRLRPAGP